MKEIKCQVLQGVADLEAIYDPSAQDDTSVFFYKGTPEHWSLTYGQLRQIWATRNFSVTSKSNKEDRGLFNIGPMKNWYYSHSLFNTPYKLELQIQDMIQFALIGTTRNSLNQVEEHEEVTA
ncbi:hypothetical protein [Vibrio sonorensis]|uniref:hypothetical protein n=1 Tax=Vibrio sonorensis TaxID=1004316 RepID=UPI0008DA6910|nr:hypothetical protein [Vibrio sonorensis]